MTTTPNPPAEKSPTPTPPPAATTLKPAPVAPASPAKPANTPVASVAKADADLNALTSICGELTQDQLDELMRIHSFIAETDERGQSLVDDISDAILDSARLTLTEWRTLRSKLSEIEEFIPHIDLIIRLKDRSR